MKKTFCQDRLKVSFLAIGGAAILLSGPALAQPAEPAFDAPALAAPNAASGLSGYVAQHGAGHGAETEGPLGAVEIPGGITLEEAYAELELRVLSTDLDPITADDVRKMDGEGLIERRKKVGEDILIFDVEIERTKRISDLVDAMGHDAFKIAYPDLYKLVENSPIILGARIRQQELKNDLEVALRGPERPEEPVAAESAAAEPEALSVREDGSSYFDMPVAGAQATQPLPDEDDLGGLEEVDLAAEAEPAEGLDAPASPADALADGTLVLTDVQDVAGLGIRETISLREVYGLGDQRRAVILHGQDRILVQVGDELPGETSIKEIGDTHIVVLRDGEEIRIQLNG